MKPSLARLLGLREVEAELSIEAETDVRSVVDLASWQAAEVILFNHGAVLRKRYPFLSEEDLARLIQQVMRKLRSLEGLRRLSVAGSPAGYLAVVLGNAVANLAAQRKSAFFAANLRLLNSKEKELFAMAFWQQKSIGEIAMEVGESYSDVAAQFFRLLRRMREDTAFKPPRPLESTENKDLL